MLYPYSKIANKELAIRLREIIGGQKDTNDFGWACTIQFWFFPTTHSLEPSVEQKKVEKADRISRFHPSYPISIQALSA